MSFFRKEKHNLQLDRQGFTKFPFLTDEDVFTIRKAYFESVGNQPEAFCTLDKVVEGERFSELNELIFKIVASRIPIFMKEEEVNYQGSTFVIKPPGNDGVVWPHQDGSMVDERFHSGYSFWIALENMNRGNGALMLMPGSHKIFKTFRAPNIRYLFEDTREILMPYLKVLPMRTGEAVMYNNRLLHGSGRNKGEQVRLALISGITKKNVESVIFYKIDDQKVGMYEIPFEERMRFTREGEQEGPDDLKLLEEIPYDSSVITKERLHKEFGIKEMRPILAKWKLRGIL